MEKDLKEFTDAAKKATAAIKKAQEQFLSVIPKYSEQDLTSFGNYLLKKYSIKQDHSVSMADFHAWQEQNNK